MQESSVYQYITEKAKGEGLEQGLEQGLKQGLEQGRREAVVESILQLLDVRFEANAVQIL